MGLLEIRYKPYNTMVQYHLFRVMVFC